MKNNHLHDRLQLAKRKRVPTLVLILVNQEHEKRRN